jgi:hypothetical protein
MAPPQRIATDVDGGTGITAPDRVPAVDLRDPQYRNYDPQVIDPGPADPEPVLPPPPNTNLFTAEAIEQARRQERDKINTRLAAERAKNTTQATELDELRAFRAATDAEAEKKAKDDARKAKKEAEKDLTAKERLDLRDSEYERQRQEDRDEMAAQLAQMRAERTQEKAQLALERSVLQLQNFISTRVNQELTLKTIAPQFVDFITGSSEEQVEASIELAKVKTAEIVAEIAGQQAGTQQRRGVGTNTGPSNIGSQTEVESEPLDYTKLTLKEYIEKVRPTLQIDKRDNGIFG